MLRHQWLEIEEVGGVTVIHVIDHRLGEGVETEELGEELFHLTDGETTRKLVLNLSSVEFLSSVGLGKLVALKRKVKARDGVMVLCGIRPTVYEMLRATRLTRLFDIMGEQADAIAALR